jgi:hypothetical protein
MTWANPLFDLEGAERRPAGQARAVDFVAIATRAPTDTALFGSEAAASFVPLADHPPRQSLNVPECNPFLFGSHPFVACGGCGSFRAPAPGLVSSARFCVRLRNFLKLFFAGSSTFRAHDLGVSTCLEPKRPESLRRSSVQLPSGMPV